MAWLFYLLGIFNGENDAAMRYLQEIEPYLKETPYGNTVINYSEPYESNWNYEI